MPKLLAKLLGLSNKQAEAGKRPDLKAEDVLLEWQAPSVLRYNRNKSWYVAISGLLAILLLIAFLLQSPTFAAALVIGAMAYFVITQDQPEILEVLVTTKGVQFGQKFFNYKELKSFWIDEHPPYYQSVHLVFDSNLKQDLTIHFQGLTAEELRALFAPYLQEWTDRKLSATEQIIKFLGL